MLIGNTYYYTFTGPERRRKDGSLTLAWIRQAGSDSNRTEPSPESLGPKEAFLWQCTNWDRREHIEFGTSVPDWAKDLLRKYLQEGVAL